MSEGKTTKKRINYVIGGENTVEKALELMSQLPPNTELNIVTQNETSTPQSSNEENGWVEVWMENGPLFPL
jgi:hypothetical protein